MTPFATARYRGTLPLILLTVLLAACTSGPPKPTVDYSNHKPWKVLLRPFLNNFGSETSNAGEQRRTGGA